MVIYERFAKQPRNYREEGISERMIKRKTAIIQKEPPPKKENHLKQLETDNVFTNSEENPNHTDKIPQRNKRNNIYRYILKEMKEKRRM